MHEISRFGWRNFQSYGNYDTSIDVKNLGDILISGNNGAGKTTIVSSLQWCIFGRTMHKSQPGPSIQHWYNKHDTVCWVEFKSGIRVERTRSRSGETNCIIHNTNSLPDLLNAAGTTKLQQLEIDVALGYDWDMFTASTCLGQFNKPWLMMSPDKRKKAIERLLKLNVFENCAENSKQLHMVFLQQHEIATNNFAEEIKKLENIANNLKLKEQRSATQKAVRENAIASLRLEIHNLEQLIYNNVKHDIAEIQKLWDVYNNIREEHSKISVKIQQLNTNKSILTRSKSDKTAFINKFLSKSDKVCNDCLQMVSHEHIGKIVADPQLELDALSLEIDKINAGLVTANNLQAQITDLMIKPTVTVQEATSHNAYVDRCVMSLQDKLSNLELLSQQQLSSQEEDDNVFDQIAQHEARLLELQKQLNEVSIEEKHVNYLYEFYSRRDRGKSLIFADHVPAINNRIAFYLDHFETPIKIKLTENLGVESDKWGYEFASGGERTGVDLALMFGLYDFHEKIYGRQSNVMFLDEADGSVDDARRQKLIELIKTDLCNRVDAIFIISHHGTMHNIFSSEYRAEKHGDESRLVEVQ